MDEEKPNISGKSEKELVSVREKQRKVSEKYYKKGPLSLQEKTMIVNTYNYVKKSWPADRYPYRLDMVKQTSSMLGISVSTIYKVLKEHAMDQPIKSRKTPKTCTDKIDEFAKSVIRKKILTFIINGEPLTVDNLIRCVNDEKDLPNYKRGTFQTLVKHLKFKFLKHNGKSVLIESNKIKRWRRNYLEKIHEYRNENRPIYYVNETCVHIEHTIQNVQADTKEDLNRQVFKKRQRKGLWAYNISNPNIIIVMNIGNENGFVNGANDILEAESSGNYEDCIAAARFETWFEYMVLPKLGNNAIVVIGNAPYHTRHKEKIPNVTWKTSDIKTWLQSKEVTFDISNEKSELLNKVSELREKYEMYAVDDIAKKFNVNVLRLPPYHCQLNPMGLIWAEIKEYVARNNTSQKLEDVKQLVIEGVKQISKDKWQHHLDQVIREEKEFCMKLDELVVKKFDDLGINVNSESDSEEITNSASDNEDVYSSEEE